MPHFQLKLFICCFFNGSLHSVTDENNTKLQTLFISLYTFFLQNMKMVFNIYILVVLLGAHLSFLEWNSAFVGFFRQQIKMKKTNENRIYHINRFNITTFLCLFQEDLNFQRNMLWSFFNVQRVTGRGDCLFCWY